MRVVGAGVVLGALVIASQQFFDEPLTMGPGYRALAWADDSEALGLLALLFVLRAVATLTTVVGGGTGGLFIPLVVQGALIGRMLAVWRQPSEDVSNLFPILGLAAFLGRGVPDAHCRGDVRGRDHRRRALRGARRSSPPPRHSW